MKIIIGSDHAGYQAKQMLTSWLQKLGYKVVDKGTDSEDSTDYPIYAARVAAEVLKGNSVGILMCGTGMGVCMAANKIKGIRAALVYNENSAALARKHNNANIMCTGGREFSAEQIRKMVKRFLESEFSNEERHLRRVSEITELEK